MTMRFLLSLLLVALSATSTVQAKKRLRGERSVIDHEPEEVQRVLKKLTVGRGAFTSPSTEGVTGALDTVRTNLARKAGGGSMGTKGATPKAPGPGVVIPVTPITSAPVPTPARKQGMGGNNSKGSKGGSNSNSAIRAFPTVAPAHTLQLPAPTRSTKESKGASSKGSSDSSKSGMSSRKGGSSDRNEVSFFHLAPNNAIPVAVSDTNFEEIGTVFVYGGPLFDVNATVIPNTNFTGVCTKTQKANVIDANRSLVGGGYCQFTYILDIAADGTPSTTMNAAGEVFDLVGGVIAITGGTGKLVRAGGEAKVLPLHGNGSLLFDFFTRAVVYEVNATIVFSSD